MLNTDIYREMRISVYDTTERISVHGITELNTPTKYSCDNDIKDVNNTYQSNIIDCEATVSSGSENRFDKGFNMSVELTVQRRSQNTTYIAPAPSMKIYCKYYSNHFL